jgi:ribulose-phosphate 3-epimerase
MLPAALRQEALLIPSILSADFSRLGEEVDRVMEAGARVVHVDIMDGHFVPNLTAGPALVEGLAPRVHERGGFLDVHLMIEEPDRFLEPFAAAGADALCVHVEAVPHLHRTLSQIRGLGATPGVAINPATDLCVLGEVYQYVDFVLAMTVNPGFGGQSFIEQSLNKVKRLSERLPNGVALQVDGGVGRETLPKLRGAGADWFVAGSAIFGAEDPGAEVAHLRGLLEGSES